MKMGDKSAIEWTDATWNPISGCSKVSPGCQHCYAEQLSHRFGWTGKPWTVGNAIENVVLHHERLDKPLHWKKPRKIFVNSMSDLFHEQVPDEFIAKIFNIMANAPWHTFQILTKRPRRMLQWFDSVKRWDHEDGSVFHLGNDDIVVGYREWPLKNVWIGVSVEDQQRADERIPLLLQTPAAVRFLSCEPLLGEVDLSLWMSWEGEHCQSCGRGYSDVYWVDDEVWRSVVDSTGAGLRCPDCFTAEAAAIGITVDVRRSTYRSGLDWIVVGGESGHGARPMQEEWAISLRDQCVSEGIPYFFKQWGEFHPTSEHLDGERFMIRVGKKAAGRLLDGRTWDEFPKITYRS